MASIAETAETAERFFQACEAGQGWAECQQYCRPDATFSAQAAAPEGIDTLDAYTEWMKGLLAPLPDGRAEVRSFAVDETRNKVSVYGVFHRTHSGDGGPVPPTGKSAAADYVYDLAFDGDKIRHLTKKLERRRHDAAARVGLASAHNLDPLATRLASGPRPGRSPCSPS